MATTSYIREQRTLCGPEYMEVDYVRVSEAQHRAGSRAKKRLASTLAQREQNDKRARRYYVQLMNTNFDKRGFHVTLTYSEDWMPESRAQYLSQLTNYIRRVRRYCARRGWQEPRYMLVPETRNEDGDDIRWHAHLVAQLPDAQPRENREFRRLLEMAWQPGRCRLPLGLDYAGEEPELMGYANADALQPDKDNLTALALYMTKSCHNMHRWMGSHNLKKPEYPRPADSKFTPGGLARAAQERIDDAPYWERRFPGYRFCGAEASFDEVRAEWSMYLRMRRKPGGTR